MNKAVKKLLAYLVSIVLVVGLIAAAPVSRLVYSVYDNNRTRQILQQLEEAAASAPAVQEAAPVSTFVKQAYVMQSQGDSSRTFDVLVLTSESGYELSHYEQVLTGTGSYTGEYFHMMGDYTREGNLLTIAPGIGVLSRNSDGGSFVHANAQFLTAEEAGGEKTRDEIFAEKLASNQIALMSDGSFAVGGSSDASDVLDAPAGRHVYTDAVLQGRVTFKTLITFDDGQYVLYSHSTNSSNAEQTTGAFFGFGSYEITQQDVAPDENAPEQTYDVVSGTIGRGFMYANNNGSHMQFDLQNDGSFSQWLATSFNAVSPTFYVTESGCTIKIGALKTNVSPWGLYIPAGEAKEAAQAPAEAEPAAPAQGLRLEVASSVEDKPFVLELKAGGVLTTGWTNYEQTVKDGKWSVADGALVLDLEEAGYTAQTALNEDGSVAVTVNYGQMGEKTYTVPAQAASVMGVNAAAPAAEAAPAAPQSLKLEVSSSVEDKPFVLTLNGDGTLVTGWTNYEQTMKGGTWAVVDGILTMDLEEAGYTAATTLNEDGTAAIVVSYGQMGDKEYTLSAEMVAAMGLKDAAPAAPQSLKLEVASSVEDKPFVLELKADGTVTTGWTNYEQTMKDGKWTVDNGTLVLVLEESGYTSQVIPGKDGSAVIITGYGQMGSKAYTLPAAAVSALGMQPEALSLKLEVETSVEGKPFVLELKADGTVTTGWTNYEQTMKDGKWTVDNGTLVLDLEEAGYTAAVAANEDGSAVITLGYGQMGDKEYTVSADIFAALAG